MTKSVELIKSNCPKTYKFLEVIFGEQLKEGLDHLKKVYSVRLKKDLPILSIITGQKKTLKKETLNWLSSLFQDRMIIVNNDMLNKKFQESYGSKHLICVSDDIIEDNTARNTNLLRLLSIRFMFFSKSSKNLVPNDKEPLWVLDHSKTELNKGHSTNDLLAEVPLFIKLLKKRTWN